MAIILQSLGGVWDSISGTMGTLARINLAGEPVNAEPGAGAASIQDPLVAAREKAVTEAMETAAKDKPARAPNLTDYWHAAMMQPALNRDPKAISNLSGLNFNGFEIRRQDLEPNAETRAVMGDIFDLDGNGGINVEAVDKFFGEVHGSLRGTNTNFYNCTFRPATTLEMVQDMVGGHYVGCHFVGLEPGKTLNIGSGNTPRGETRAETFRDIFIENAHGAEVNVRRGAVVHKLTMEHGETTLRVGGGAQINNLTVEDENVTLIVEDRGTLRDPRFVNATFKSDSSFAKAILRGEPSNDTFEGFRDSNLSGISFDHAQISGIDFIHSNINGAKFTNARLTSVQFSQDMDLTVADFRGATVTNVQIVRLNERGIPEPLMTFNSPTELKAYIAAQQDAKDRNGGVFVPIEPQAAALPAPANRAEALARGTDLTWNGDVATTVTPVMPLQNAVAALENNKSDSAVRFQQVNTVAGMQGVGALPAASANAPARKAEGGDIPANATPQQRMAAIGAALTENFGQPVVKADQNSPSLESQKGITNSAEGREHRHAIAEARMAELGLLR